MNKKANSNRQMLEHLKRVSTMHPSHIQLAVVGLSIVYVLLCSKKKPKLKPHDLLLPSPHNIKTALDNIYFSGDLVLPSLEK